MIRLLWAIIAALFSGLVAAGTHDREPCSPSATLHRAAEAPAADRAGGSGVLGNVAARVGKMVRCGRHREARDGDWLAPRGLRPLLEVALQTGKVAWPGSGWTGGPRSRPEDGARERVGRSADPRRVAEAGAQGLRAHRLALPATAGAFTGTKTELVHVPPEPPGGDRGHGLLRGVDSDFPRPVRLVRDKAFPARDRALERHGESDGAGGRSRYLVLDRDTIFSRAVVTAIESMGLEPTRTSYQSPWQNGVAERFVGTVRRDLLEHVIVLDDKHLRRLLGEYLAYYHGDRMHLGVEKDAPVVRPVDLRPARAAAVHAHRRVGGLHHRYEWATAA